MLLSLEANSLRMTVWDWGVSSTSRFLMITARNLLVDKSAGGFGPLCGASATLLTDADTASPVGGDEVHLLSEAIREHVVSLVQNTSQPWFNPCKVHTQRPDAHNLKLEHHPPLHRLVLLQADVPKSQLLSAASHQRLRAPAKMGICGAANKFHPGRGANVPPPPLRQQGHDAPSGKSALHHVDHHNPGLA
eukprot:CAMPEP_0204433796 /NCGR_PEP_ID=MMETSP0470-20130426/70276_1 /ASSEMBLY_ACC=CAM_ASM_000385 /TAXON_ID=2969 /ORGANISM="Oxyrrhis marina" /LENGTH=190 /DNA_ID=CAMNT_0051432229 /DNA_START=352 /DNA_END=923 /DNA_ORIENTATION=-